VDGELWDVTDAAGIPSGRTHRRGDPGVPAGAFDVVAGTCVVRDDGLVLITQRAAVKDWPLAWEFPAGSALAGETSREAAARELGEETGLLVAPAALVFVGRHSEESALVDVYVAHGLDTGAVVLDPAEVMAHAWVPLDEVTRLCASGLMAQPRVERLDVLWPALVDGVASGPEASGRR
jgi:8-oxo-dGTP pyrophosphatase MutT (NUDIX family)